MSCNSLQQEHRLWRCAVSRGFVFQPYGSVLVETPRLGPTCQLWCAAGPGPPQVLGFEIWSGAAPSQLPSLSFLRTQGWSLGQNGERWPAGCGQEDQRWSSHGSIGAVEFWKACAQHTGELMQPGAGELSCHRGRCVSGGWSGHVWSRGEAG